MPKINFKKIHDRAIKRKGSEKKLNSLLPKITSKRKLQAVGDDRCLSVMTKVINQAGFHWGVIERKWPQFEEAYFGFDTNKLSLLSPDQWEGYTQDKRVVRNWQKIKATYDNLGFINETSAEYGSFAKFIAQWPKDDQVGLMTYLKKQGSRLGGNSGQRFLRIIGFDAFILYSDMIAALQHAGLDITDSPTSKRDLTRVQDAMNEFHDSTGLPYTHLGKILTYSIGKNYAVEVLQEYANS